MQEDQLVMGIGMLLAAGPGTFLLGVPYWVATGAVTPGSRRFLDAGTIGAVPAFAAFFGILGWFPAEDHCGFFHFHGLEVWMGVFVASLAFDLVGGIAYWRNTRLAGSGLPAGRIAIIVLLLALAFLVGRPRFLHPHERKTSSWFASIPGEGSRHNRN